MERTVENCNTVCWNKMLTLLLHVFVLTNGPSFVESKTQAAKKMHHYKGIEGEPYAMVMKYSSSECMRHCTLVEYCTAIAYERKFPICKLYNTISSDIHLEDKAGSIVVLKSDFAIGGDEFCGASGCPTIECGPIEEVKYATVFGNQVVIGSRLKYVCNNGDKNVTYVVCGNDGDWSELPTCPACPDGFDQHNNSCYMFSNNGATWEDARQTCISVGAKLAEVEDNDENEYIRHRTIQIGATLYIGLTDFTGQWMWNTSNAPLVNIYWASGEPNRRDEHCVSYESHILEGDWADILCSRVQRYICEIDLQ